MLFRKLQSELLVSTLDVESSMAYVSAIREVADAEQSGSFCFNRQGYEHLASTIAKMAEGVDGDFSQAYRAVAERVEVYVQSL